MDSMDFKVTIKTGNEKNSGTDCKVKIKIIGSKSETSFHVLDDPLQNDFEKGSIHDYIINDVDVGDLECLSLKVSQKFYDFLVSSSLAAS